MESSPAILTRSALVDAFRDLGIRAGMGLMVHSSLRSFGHVDGGAMTVIRALQEVLTPDGTLLLPSFNHGAPFGKGGSGVYDPQTTPTSNGAIPETFRALQDVHRSLNPTHPFAAWGCHAERYTRYHHRTLTMGRESPLGLLHADDGHCLLLGVTYASNTFHHLVEIDTGAPCLGRRTEALPVQLPDGRRVLGRTWSWRERSCPLTAPGFYEREMVRRGLQAQGQIGACRAVLFRLRDCYEVVSALLAQGNGTHPPCSRCPIRPMVTPHTVLTDWDEANHCLLPESAAWTY